MYKAYKFRIYPTEEQKVLKNNSFIVIKFINCKIYVNNKLSN